MHFLHFSFSTLRSNHLSLQFLNNSSLCPLFFVKSCSTAVSLHERQQPDVSQSQDLHHHFDSAQQRVAMMEWHGHLQIHVVQPHPHPFFFSDFLDICYRFVNSDTHLLRHSAFLWHTIKGCSYKGFICILPLYSLHVWNHLQHLQEHGSSMQGYFRTTAW